MEKEKSSPYTFFILRNRLVNLQDGIFAIEKEKNYGRRKNRKTKSTGQSIGQSTGNHRQAKNKILYLVIRSRVSKSRNFYLILCVCGRIMYITLRLFMRTFGSFTKMGNPHKRGIIWLYLITDYGNY